MIARYIFPGGELDHIGMTVTNLERLGFEVHDVESWREHFQKTCRLWAERLYARKDDAISEIGWLRTACGYRYHGFVLGFRVETRHNWRLSDIWLPSGVPDQRAFQWTRHDLYR